MPLPCNIDSRGKVVRLVYGVVLMVVAIALLLAWALPTGSVRAWVATTVCALGGAFALWEARAGWCVVRAMGFKTPV
jgi:hypothetical protein